MILFSVILTDIPNMMDRTADSINYDRSVADIIILFRDFCHLIQYRTRS